MEIKGTIFKMLPMETGKSARGGWNKMSIIIEQPGEYPKKAMVELWGDKATDAETDLTEGMQITAYVNVEAREYNDRWYNTIRCWKFDVKDSGSDYVKPQSGAGAPAKPTSGTPVKNDEPDDLPF